MRKKNQADEVQQAIINFLFEFGAYAATVLGVLFSEYLPELRQSIEIEFTTPSISKLFGAAFIALLVSFFMQDGTKDKFQPFKNRLLTHFAYGVMWVQILKVIWG